MKVRGPPCPHQPLYEKINPKDCQGVETLGDSGFLQVFRVVSSDEMANPEVVDETGLGES